MHKRNLENVWKLHNLNLQLDLGNEVAKKAMGVALNELKVFEEKRYKSGG